jgi:uncharacterized SAM-binding protein YcdF (DUF218 family)
MALERQYPPYDGQPVAVIWVLGGGHTSDRDLPVSSQISSQSLYRVVEGVRLARMNPSALLVFSGYGGTDPEPAAELNRRLAISLGVDSTRIITQPHPRDTREEAVASRPIVGDRPFALVTSATHMARAVTIFQNQGLEPIPAPTGHLARRPAERHALDFIPSSTNLRTSRQIWYEFLGTIWEKVRGPS